MNPNSQPNRPYVNPLNAMREGEIELFSVKRHPIGLIGIYASFIGLLLIVAVIAFLAPDLLADSGTSSVDGSTVGLVGAAVFLVALLFAGLFSFVARIVYYGNRWILTSDSVTQVSQTSLFNKQSSQLSLGNLEDVTVVQDGILPHMFNYGILRCETAGEHSKFTFAYCPDPNSFAQKILVARENFEQGKLYSDERPDHRPNLDSTPPTVTAPGDPTRPQQ